jgi:FkbM family methyltransferase
MACARYYAILMSRAALQQRISLVVTRRLTRVLRALGLREPALRARKRLTRSLRHALEARGLDRLSRPALHDIERKLDAAIARDGGFYVEAGANDGFTQSNTYWLERFRAWRGILIEPMPTLLEECRRERPDATVVQAALVPGDHEPATVRMQFGDLMSSVHGAHGDSAAERRWVEPGLAVGWRDPYEVDVPARTLSSILEEHGAPEVDLLSLDVEGFEPQALRGLDLDRHAPRWIAVEAHDLDAGRKAIEEVLGDRYVLETKLSPLDLLYRRRDLSSSSSSGTARSATSNTA